MKISKNDIYSKIFGFNPSTYYRWKENRRPIIDLINKYFSVSELNDFLNEKQIQRFELSERQKQNRIYISDKYINIFLKEISLFRIENQDFLDFYINILVYSKHNMESINVYKPFNIQKASLLYMPKYEFEENFFNKEENEYEEFEQQEYLSNLFRKQYFTQGIEIFDEFDCYTNQFLEECILLNFNPLIEIMKDELEFIDEKKKIIGYMHALLFITYNRYPKNTREEKKVLLVDLIEELYRKYDTKQKKQNIPKGLKSTPILKFSENTNLLNLLEKDINLIEKNFDELLSNIENYRFQDE